MLTFCAAARIGHMRQTRYRDLSATVYAFLASFALSGLVKDLRDSDFSRLVNMILGEIKFISKTLQVTGLHVKHPINTTIS